MSHGTGSVTGDGGTDVAVRVEGITKRFAVRRPLLQTVLHPFSGSRATVVEDVTFEANAGEFLGLLGPNGAGKTTLLKMLATLVLPDSGTASIDGHDVVRDPSAVRERVSPCLAQERSLYYRLSARQNLEVFADLQGVPRAGRSARVAEVLAAVSLGDTGDKMVGQFSSGMMQRLLIARALLTRPRVLLLDEPTRSLDPISARGFRQFLRDELARQRGCAVILATHNAEEAFELCDRVGVLHQGRLLARGVARQLAREYLGARFQVLTDTPTDPAFGELATLGAVVTEGRQSDEDGWHSVTLRLPLDADPSAVVSLLSSRGVRIAAFEPVKASLADLIEGVVGARS